jgi:hypothetical protein
MYFLLTPVPAETLLVATSLPGRKLRLLLGYASLLLAYASFSIKSKVSLQTGLHYKGICF